MCVRAGYYYKLNEAEEIKQTYSSWVGKKAHAGKGILATLTDIIIKEKRSRDKIQAEKNYRVIFEFENKKKFAAHEFLKINSLIPQKD